MDGDERGGLRAREPARLLGRDRLGERGVARHLRLDVRDLFDVEARVVALVALVVVVIAGAALGGRRVCFYGGEPERGRLGRRRRIVHARVARLGRARTRNAEHGPRNTKRARPCGQTV